MPLIFPRDVFKAKGARAFASLLCTSQESYDKALAAGYFATVPEALNLPPVAPRAMPPAPEPASLLGSPNFATAIGVDDESRPTRSELEAEAKRLGVKLDSRNSDERLAERIMEAHAAIPSEG